MNTYAKFCPNVFVAKCPDAHQKGDVIILTSKYGKETEVEIHMWGSDNICVKEKKKFGWKNLAQGLCGAGLGDLMVEFMQKMKMVGKSVKWSKIGFYFA